MELPCCSRRRGYEPLSSGPRSIITIVQHHIHTPCWARTDGPVFHPTSPLYQMSTEHALPGYLDLENIAFSSWHVNLEPSGKLRHPSLTPLTLAGFQISILKAHKLALHCTLTLLVCCPQQTTNSLQPRIVSPIYPQHLP